MSLYPQDYEIVKFINSLTTKPFSESNLATHEKCS